MPEVQRLRLNVWKVAKSDIHAWIRASDGHPQTVIQRNCIQV